MGLFLDIAYLVLSRHGEPLGANDIVEYALKWKLLSTKGMTPAQTMKSKLSTDILRHGEKSLFMRTDKGKFGLRAWCNKIDEFVADRFKKSLFDENIVVFPADSLPDLITRSGLTKETPHLDNIRSFIQPMSRREAEKDESVIQLVSVFIVRHKNQVLTYKRTKRLPESRLHGYYSLSFGGHLNPDDISPLFNIFYPDQGLPFILREFHEEVKIDSKSIIDLKYLGLLYEPSMPVSRQHLGITYEVLVSSDKFCIGERGFLIDPKFETAAQIHARRNEFENWSLKLLDELGGSW
jgi:predicted NUDIX family phosphoesterase